jgi:hypothetical protein
MHPLSESARLVLDRMKLDHTYGVQELRTLAGDAGVERVREIMHELWIHRHVERAGYSAWRRQRSAPPQASRPVAGDAAPVKPEDLFDHEAFAEFFE